jgi:hypothetical protein
LYAKQKAGGGGSSSAVLSATSLEFGKVGRDTTRDLTLTLSAATAAGVRVKSFSVENEAVPGTFTVTSPSGPFPIAVPMGAPLTITIRFKPAEIAVAAADLYIGTDAASGGDLHVTLAGEGVQPVASVNAPGAASGLALVAVPNPARGAGAVRVTLPRAGVLRMVLYDALGRACLAMFDGALDRGEHTIALDVSALAAGRYTCVATVNGAMIVEPITVAR